MRWIWGVALLAAGAGPTAAQEYLEQVESPAYEAVGDVPALTARAATCAAQLLKPGVSTAPVVLARDLPGGVVVANNYFVYGETTFLGPLALDARSKVRVEVRSGRYRILHSDIEVFHRNWYRMRTPKPGKRSEMREQLQAISDKLAACIGEAKAPADW